MRRIARIAALACSMIAAVCAPVRAQQLPDGQGEAEYRVWLAANPQLQGQIMSFESWQEAAGVRGVLPTWQILRTASMWRECGGQPFEVPPFTLWPGLTMTLRYIRDWVKPAVGDVDAVSGYRNPSLNRCARGAQRSAHVDYFALDLVPRVPLARRELFRRLCAMHARSGRAFGTGLGFYSFQRFHIDTRSFRRWGAAGPRGNESPCALIERGEDPLGGAVDIAPPPAAPPPPPPPPPPPAAPPTAADLLTIETAMLPPPPARRRPPRPPRIEGLSCSAVVAGRVNCSYRIDRCERGDASRRGGYCLRTRSLLFQNGRWTADIAPSAHLLPPGRSPNPVG
ncbi:MAG: hypothetical protein AB7H79_07150 [Sphingomonas sp.]